MKSLLLPLELVSGLRIIAKKTQIFRVSTVDEWDHIIQVWGWKSGEFPTMYLGLLLGAWSKFRSLWEPQLDRLSRKLAMWKRVYMSKGGCVILIKSTLSSILVFMLAARLIPVSMCLEIKKLLRIFLWGSIEGSNKFNLKPWEDNLLASQFGGLWTKNIW